MEHDARLAGKSKAALKEAAGKKHRQLAGTVQGAATPAAVEASNSGPTAPGPCVVSYPRAERAEVASRYRRWCFSILFVLLACCCQALCVSCVALKEEE